MRVLIAAAVIAFGIADANAADLYATGDYYFQTRYHAQRAAPLVTYDFQPGVLLRAYWQAPWGRRHYYPYTGHRPKIGRAENLFAARNRPEPSKTFQRNWSTPWALLPEPRDERFIRPPLRGK